MVNEPLTEFALNNPGVLQAIGDCEYRPERNIRMYFCQRLINGTRLAVLIILGQVDIVDKVFYGQRAFFSFAFCDNEKIPLEIFPVNRQCAHKFPIAHHSTLLYNPITHA